MLVEFGGGDEGLEVFFDDQAIGDGVGFDFLVAKVFAEEGDEKFILEGEFAHGVEKIENSGLVIRVIAQIQGYLLKLE